MCTQYIRTSEREITLTLEFSLSGTNSHMVSQMVHISYRSKKKKKISIKNRESKREKKTKKRKEERKEKKV